MKIRLITAETTGTRNCLIKSGMNATILSNLGQQTFAICRSKFFNLSISQQWTNELWPLVMKFL